MIYFSLKYRLMKRTAGIFGDRKLLSCSADELRKRYSKNLHVINFPDRAVSKKLEYERRLEHGVLSTFLTHRDSIQALLYIPDKKMLQFPVAKDYKLFERLALETGRDVIIPYCLPCIEHAMNESVDMIYEVYRHLIPEYGEGNVAVAGCSTGGALALALISHINARGENVPMPDKLYVSSPEMCICSQEERERAEKLDKTDIFVPVKWLDTYYDLITNGSELPQYMPYPQLGNYAGLKEAYVSFADCEVLYAMCDDLVSRMESAGVQVALEVGQGMYHGYPVNDIVRDSFWGHINMIDYLKAVPAWKKLVTAPGVYPV